MWRQFDSPLFVRVLLPWLPLFILLQAEKVKATVPEILGSATVVLAGRLLVDGNFKGILSGFFGLVPLVGSVLLITGVVQNVRVAWVYYLMAALGTVLAVVSEVRQRR